MILFTPFFHERCGVIHYSKKRKKLLSSISRPDRRTMMRPSNVGVAKREASKHQFNVKHNITQIINALCLLLQLLRGGGQGLLRGLHTTLPFAHQQRPRSIFFRGGADLQDASNENSGIFGHKRLKIIPNPFEKHNWENNHLLSIPNGINLLSGRKASRKNAGPPLYIFSGMLPR